MGTNYYWKAPSPTWMKCGECGGIHLRREELHIGKNSFGWLFSLQILPERGIEELKDWIPLLRTGEIRNEYGELVSCKEMIKTILKKDWVPDLSEEAERKRMESLKSMNEHYGAAYAGTIWNGLCPGPLQTVQEEDSKLFRMAQNKKGKLGNYCLVKGWFA